MSERAQKKVLIVDDESEIREIIADDLRAKDYFVFEADGGESAKELLNSNDDIDVVVTDIAMPNGSGLELLDFIKTRNLEYPCVILVSAYSDISVPDAYDLGAEAFFAKPFDRKKLIAAIERIVRPPSAKWRRSDSRADIDQHIEMQISLPDFSAAATRASILNIGRGGMFLAWGAEMPEPGENISFSISFLQKEAIEFSGSGVVRWVRLEREEGNILPGFGLEFTELEGEHYSNFMDVLNFIKTKAYIPKS